MILLYSGIGVVCFLSLFWGVWSMNYFFGGQSFSGVAQILPQDMAYMIFAVGLPIILLLMVVVVAISFVSSYVNRDILATIAKNSKGELSTMQVIARSLIEVRKVGFSQQFFSSIDIIFNDVSSCLIDVISKLGIASDVVIFDIFNKSRDERLFSACKIILAARASTPHFDELLRRKVKKDIEIAGFISIFSYKYNNLIGLVRKYDLDSFISKMLDEGQLGQVHNILTNAVRDDNIPVKSDVNMENVDSFDNINVEKSLNINLESIIKIVDE